ncbi:hypothetical protein [Bacillus weihaiensis]|uniref:hypothetical protein n=1 Tax=Bacillus weihaiensis TaxID=1547283 RepID=UPI0023556372|nr:hypothetical protein [Bacillus weihaiensis]
MVLKVKQSLVIGVLLLVLPVISYATSWPYSFVVWDRYVYVVSDEEVKNVKNNIGKVTRYSDMEQYGGNFSNAYGVGTKYYSIEGIDPDVAIAIEVKDGTYLKAIRGEKYAYGNGILGIPSNWLIGGSILFLILVYLMFFLERKARR